MSGPEVTARPGTKRHLKQVRARAVFTTIQAVTAAGAAKRAAAAYEAAKANTAALQAQVDVATMLILAVSPAAGNA